MCERLVDGVGVGTISVDTVPEALGLLGRQDDVDLHLAPFLQVREPVDWYVTSG